MQPGVRSYRLYHAPHLDIAGPVLISNQLALETPEDVPDSRIAPLTGPLLPTGVQAYSIRHEMVVEQVGKAKGQEFLRFVASHDMEGYQWPARAMIAFRGARPVVRSFAAAWKKRARDALGPIVGYNVDFQKLEPHVSVVEGAWFRFNEPQLTSSAHFGHHVDQSLEYQAAKKIGKMSAMRYWHSFRGETVPIMVGSSCSITIQQPVETIEVDLEIVTDVLDLLQRYGALEVSEEGRRSRKTTAGDAPSRATETGNPGPWFGEQEAMGS